MTDTPPPLDELRLALSKATPGPWRADVWGNGEQVHGLIHIFMDATEISIQDVLTEDAEAICLLRNNADQLLDLAALGLLVREGGKEVLRPFAEAAECLDNPNPDNMEIWEHSAAMCITAGDLRRARKFLRTLEGLVK